MEVIYIKTKTLRNLIIITLIIILVIIMVVFYIYSKNELNSEGTDYNDKGDFETKDTFESSYILKDEIQTNRYYTVKDIIEKYLKSIYSYNNYDGRDLNYMAMTEEALNEAIENQKQSDLKLLQNIVAEECIEEFNISDYNNYKGYNINIDNMLVAEISSYMNIYLVYGTIINTGEEVKLMTILDHNTSAYVIYPQKYLEENNLINLKAGDTIDISIDSVEKNNFNSYKYKNIDTQTIAIDYFEDYKYKLNNDIEDLYNSLDEEYRNKRFGSVDNFNEYVNKNFEELNGAVFSEYLVNNLEDCTEYVCKDQYDNVYIFRATAAMKYSLLLDTYTIETDKFKSTYSLNSDQGKVLLNIDKWFLMLNNRDYNAAYNVLDEEFRNQYFSSLSEFEQYMRENYPLHYEIKYGDFSNEGNIYIQEIQLSDITGSSDEVKEFTVIMALDNENNSFIMSFKV